MESANFSYNFNYKYHFFTHVTNSVVIAVAESDVGNPQVTEMLHRITSWDVRLLEKATMVTFLTCGRVTYKEGGVAVHEEARDPTRQPNYRVNIREDDVWSVFSLDKEIFAEGDGLHLYAVLNVGLEGWCVLASDFHTVFHVLKNHGMSAEHLMGQDTCDHTCLHRQDNLVPRVRPALLRHPIRLRHPRHIKSLRLGMQTLNVVALAVAPFSEDAEIMRNSLIVFYLGHCDTDTNNCVEQCLVAGFDLTHRKHRAIGQNSCGGGALVVVHDEQDWRGFLTAISPLLRTYDQSNKNAFLRIFTHINPVNWEEAATIISERVSLRDLAFNRVSQLPIEYLERYAPHQLCRKVRYTQNIIPWNRFSKREPEDVT